MAYYAILVPPFTGHLNPLSVLGKALQARGHRIAFISTVDVEAKLRRAGFDFISIANEELPPGRWKQITDRNARLVGLQATRCLMTGVGLFMRGIIRELPGIAEREGFDGLILDQVAVGGESVCEVIKLPMALACAALIFHTESGVPPCTFPWAQNSSLLSRGRNVLGQMQINLNSFAIVPPLLSYRRKHGLPRVRWDHVNVMPPSRVQVSQQPAFFDFKRTQLPSHFHYTGPWVEKDALVVAGETHFPWDRLDGRPLIYASMGTLQNGLEHVFYQIAEACAGLDAQVVISLGSSTAVIPTNLPGNPIVVAYAPQRALLKRARMVITHGGLNTTLESLMEGVPLVALPVTNDQPGVAARLRHLGAGEFIPVNKVTVPDLRAKIEQVWSTPSFRERAMWCQREMSKVDGPGLAAELIEQGLSGKQQPRGINQPCSNLDAREELPRTP